MTEFGIFPDDPTLHRQLPKWITDALYSYHWHGAAVKPFLRAVLENQLIQSMALCEPNQRKYLPVIAYYIYCKLPQKCLGSKEKVARWLDMSSEQRRKYRRIPLGDSKKKRKKEVQAEKAEVL